jgi:LuxR family maltose regulon positive regulatory protein
MADQLLATKLYAPPMRSSMVTRHHLRTRLRDGLQAGRRVTLVSAPAGFGKTTAVSEWLADGAVGAWLSLDNSDNDLMRFWRYVTTTIHQAIPPVGAAAKTLLFAPADSGNRSDASASALIESMLTGLINEIGAQPLIAPLLLFLDDYHTIHSQSIHDTLSFLIDHLPSQMHVVIVSRADPPLPLARWRVRDQLIELRAADLRFSTDESAFFLNQVMRLNLPSEAVATLDARTEGWPAGLQLAAISLQGRSAEETNDFLASFAGANRHVHSYLTEEVLLRQSPQVADFLLRTSILQRLTAPLCAAITGQADSQKILEMLDKNNLFIVPLDDEQRWFRYHALFAEALQQRLQREQPDLVVELHRVAAGWYASNGQLRSAIDHALAAGDYEHAAQVVEQAYRRLGMAGELVTLRRWLDALPPEIFDAHPRLHLARVWALGYSAQFDLLDQSLQQAETALAKQTDAESALARGEAAALRAVLASMHWQTRQALAFTEEALRLLPASAAQEDRWLRTVILQAQGNEYRLNGHVEPAERAFVEAVAIARSLDSPFLLLATGNRLGQVQILQGRLHQAAQTYTEILHDVSGAHGESHWFGGSIYVHLADIHREWNDLDQALALVNKGLDLCKRADNRVSLIAGNLILSRIQRARDDEHAAIDAISEAERFLGGYRVSPMRHYVTAHHVALEIAWHHPEQATERLTALQDEIARASDIPLLLEEMIESLHVRLALAKRQTNGLVSRLTHLLTRAESARRTHSVIELLALRSITFAQQGFEREGQRDLVAALTLAESEGFTRIFLDEGPTMLHLLGSLAKPERVAVYARRLLAAATDGVSLLTAGSGGASLNDTLELVEPLTEREIEILRLVAVGATNQDIAEQLVITVGTVKGHLNHILGKLNARNRTEAVAHARRLGVLAG